MRERERDQERYNYLKTKTLEKHLLFLMQNMMKYSKKFYLTKFLTTIFMQERFSAGSQIALLKQTSFNEKNARLK